MLRIAALALSLPAFGAVALASSCRHPAAPPSPSAPPSSDPSPDGGGLELGVDDDGKSVDLAPGATLTFRLANHSGTGYAWVPAPLDGQVLSADGGRTTDVPSDVPGAAKMDVYRFVARSPGTVVVELNLERPWEKHPPAKTLHVTVHVH